MWLEWSTVTTQRRSGKLRVVNSMKSNLQFLSCAAVLLAGFTCSAQTIVFHVITDRSKPLEKRKASISLEGFKNGEPVGHGQIAETDQNGEARFTLPSPSPGHFFFYVDLGSPYWYCSCNGIPRTQEVAQTGIVQSAAGKYSHESFEPKPGEVLIVARKFSFMDRFLYPLMKH